VPEGPSLSRRLAGRRDSRFHTRKCGGPTRIIKVRARILTNCAVRLGWTRRLERFDPTPVPLWAS
jgi:hypothetical protein